MVHFSFLSPASSFATPFLAGLLRWMIEPQRERSSISPCPFLLVVDNTVILTVSVYPNSSVNCDTILMFLMNYHINVFVTLCLLLR